MKVLNFGSLNLDYVYQVESILIPGETQASKSRQIFCGGKGLNQSIALAKAGIPVYHAGLIFSIISMAFAVCIPKKIHSISVFLFLAFILCAQGKGGQR